MTNHPFWKHVVVKGLDECWEWTYSHNTDGYGQFYWRGRLWRASRVAWILTRGEQLNALHACHSCDNPGCVNPTHLWAGDHSKNMKDMVAKGRTKRALPPEKIQEVLKHLREGKSSINAIAKIFKVSNSTIQKIKEDLL